MRHRGLGTGPGSPATAAVLVRGKGRPREGADDYLCGRRAAIGQELRQVLRFPAHDIHVRVLLGQQLREDRVDLHRDVPASAVEATLDYAGARSGTGTELDHHRLTAFGYRRAELGGIATELDVTAAI